MARVSCHLPLGGVVVGFGGEVEWQPDFSLAKIEQHHLESTNEQNAARLFYIESTPAFFNRSPLEGVAGVSCVKLAQTD